MHTSRLPLVGIVILALSLAPAAVLAQDEAEGVTSRYLAGKLIGLGSTDYENPLGCEPWVIDDEGTEAPTPTLTNTVIGETTLLGPTAMMSELCLSFTAVLDDVTKGTFTMGGDSGELSGTWSGDCTPIGVAMGEQFMCTGLMEVTGGTGMYEGASGQFRTNADYWNAGFDSDGLWKDSPTAWFIEGLVEY